MGSRRGLFALILASVVVGFSVGLVVGQIATPARAQTEPTPSVDEKAAAIKQRLVGVITECNSWWTEEQQKSMGVASGMGRSNTEIYLAALASIAAQDTVFAHYVRYMSGVLRSSATWTTGSSITKPGLLLQDRFLDHFSHELASTGLPPLVPPLTDDEWKKIGPSTNPFSSAMHITFDVWPYSQAAATLFGVD